MSASAFADASTITVLATEPLAALLADPAVQSPPEWVVRPFFERGTLASVYGPGKVGKSTMLADIVAHVALGRSWAGQPVSAGPVLWIDLEQGRRRLARTFGTMAPEATARVHVFSGFGTPPGLAALKLSVETISPALVVIDSLAKFCQVEDENDNSAWQAALRPLEALARESSAAFVVIDHDRKGEGEHGRAMRGASSKLAAFDAAIHLQRGTTATSRVLKMVSREVGDFTFTVERTADGYRTTSGPGCVVLAMLASMEGAATSKLVHDRLLASGYNATEKTVRNRLHTAVAEGRAVQRGTGTKNDATVYEAVREAA